MKNRIGNLSISLVCFLVTFIPAFAQVTWLKAYGGPNNVSVSGYSVCETSEEGFIALGSSGDIYLFKTDAWGETLWAKKYSGMRTDWGRDIKGTRDGGYIIVGWSNSFSHTGNADEVWLIKTDSNGETLWSRTYYSGNVGDYGNAVQQTKDGGYIIAGLTYTQPGGGFYLVKSDSLGTVLWIKSYAGLSEGWDVHETEDGGYIVVGVCNYVPGEMKGDVCILKTDSTGNFLWSKMYGGSGEWNQDRAWSIDETRDGGFIIVGSTQSFGHGGDWLDVWLIKTDPNGDTLWTKTFGDSLNDEGYSIEETKDGGFIIAGYTTPSTSDWKVYLIKTDSVGNLVWERKFGNTQGSEGWDVHETKDGGYIICGRIVTPDKKKNQVLLIKTDSLGNVGIKEKQTPYAGNRFSFSVFPDPVHTILTVQFSAKIQKQITLDIYNALGSKVWGNNFFDADKISIDIRTFPAGVYFLKAETGNKTITKKVTILR